MTSRNQCILFFLCLNLLLVSASFAQIESPDREVLFEQDSKKNAAQAARRQKEFAKTDKPLSEGLEFKAPDVQFNSEKNTMVGDGGVYVAYQGSHIQAESGTVNLDTKQAELSGGVVMTSREGSLRASQMSFDMEKEVGSFDDADMYFEGGDYVARADKMQKVSEFKYKLDTCGFTTCQCADGDKPWEFGASSADIEQEGYAKLKGMKFRVDGIPVLYSPYFIFPVKSERDSGLLAPEFGYSSQDGAQFRQPVFVVLDDYSDLTLTPFIESRTRRGLVGDYRKVFSSYNSANIRFHYSDESPRDGDLRGTNVNNLFDPSIDDDRLGGFYKHTWVSANDDLPLSYIADLRYVSDDLFAREIEDEDIARANARYVTSRARINAGFSDFITAELAAEFNQSLETDDDLVLQRIPEISIDGLKSFRPFGTNPYGLKVVAKGEISAIAFNRKTGFDGQRYDIHPSVKVPFHYKNYFNVELAAGVRQTFYNLDDNVNPSNGSLLDESNDRLLPDASATISTELERVYSVPESGFLSFVTGIGPGGAETSLERVKHLLEPSIKYNFVPDTSQGDLPLFDSLDRINERSLFTFGLRSSLIGRFESRRQTQDAIGELTPELEDLPILSFDRGVDDFAGLEQFEALKGGVSGRSGEQRDLLVFDIRQSYDYKEDVENNDASRRAWSDIAADIELYPNDLFKLKFDSNIDSRFHGLSSWGMSAQIKDERGDALRARYSYVDNRLSQLEGNLELGLTSRVKVGYYTKFDDTDGEFIENRVALRLLSACNCWKVDIGYRDQTNPNNNQFGVTFTLKGLGELGS